MALLFVYGTMMSKGRNHARLWENHAIRIGNETPSEQALETGIFYTADTFCMYVRPDGAPVAIPHISGHSIRGELYAVPNDLIENIDLMEGHPDVYRRQLIVLREFNEANNLAVHMYIYQSEIEDFRKISPNHDRVLYYDP
jgi:gamma-glutamylcyclotransferase (GGCT)/AIG2-like uncharacterized protein YtfP